MIRKPPARSQGIPPGITGNGHRRDKIVATTAPSSLPASEGDGRLQAGDRRRHRCRHRLHQRLYPHARQLSQKLAPRRRLDPDALPEIDALAMDFESATTGAKAWKDIWGSGQASGAIGTTVPVATLINRLERA
jgi:hypothetical protein